MRNREVIEREIHDARQDLEASLAELRHVVQEKVDVKARARVAVAKGKLRAEELYEEYGAKAKFFLQKGKFEAQQLANKGKDGARDLYVKGRETVEERPVLIGSIAAGVIAVGAFIYIGRKNEWF
ncbi:MAG TPA: hypothetical protein VMZ53_02685 [Kofleriaceae bacterium]|nr:hypothetical protein [Kofleriaceae bacterium]